MSKSTTPVPAPAGYKWVVSRSAYRGYEFDLGLWREDAKVDRNGVAYHPHGGVLYLTHEASVEPFYDECQIRRASKRALRTFWRNKVQDDMAERLLGEL